MSFHTERIKSCKKLIKKPGTSLKPQNNPGWWEGSDLKASREKEKKGGVL